MCGIAGVFRPDQPTRIAADLQRMGDTIRHRGPDGEGYLIIDICTQEVHACGGPTTPAVLGLPSLDSTDGRLGHVGFAHRRLSILDITPAGHQPMVSRSGCWITYNGEIYNYVELRDELRAEGHEFRTGSDTEVILAAYEHWGEKCLSRFVGMWAFALWDPHRRRLFCARDRFGIKPFYYAWDGKRFLFGSEIKAIRTVLPRAPAPFAPAVYEFLVFGLTDRGADTFLEGINRLEPGCLLHIDVDGKLDVQRWYDVSVCGDLSGAFTPAQERERIDGFAAVFRDAIRIHLRSDVASGTCLSGGLDSSSIVCAVNALLLDTGVANRTSVGEVQRTFSACYDDPRFDERPFIEHVLEHTGAEANYVFPDGGRLWDELDRVLWHQDEPFWSTSMYAQWDVMRRVRERGVTVVLDGQGGDEVLGGYHNYYAVHGAQLLRSGRLVEVGTGLRAMHRVTGRSPGGTIAQALYQMSPVGLKRVLRATLGRIARPA